MNIGAPNITSDAQLQIQLQIIGWMMRDVPGARDRVARVVHVAEHFDPPLNRVVLAIGRLSAVGDVSPPAVALQMSGDAGLAEIGGVEFLREWTLAAPVILTAAEGHRKIDAALDMIRQAWLRRRIAGQYRLLGDTLAAGGDDAAEQIAALNELARAARSPQKAITATPFCWTDPSLIPARAWIYRPHLVRKFASATVAAGGVGKTALEIVEDLALVTGRPLLGVTPAGMMRVWLWNLEDPLEELYRRIAGACLHYQISQAGIGDHLFVDSGREQPCRIAEADRFGSYIVEPIVDDIVAQLIEKKIDVLRIDPFVSSHGVSENDNGMIDMVAKKWGQIADRANCAIDLVHHSRKTGAEVTAEDGRGAVALINACRSVRVLNRMSEDEAGRAGVENNRLFFKVTNDKVNLAPPSDKATWFRLESIDIGNGPPSDHVGVVVPWTWPDAFDGVEKGTLFAVQKAVAAGEWRESPQAKKWAGAAVAQVLHLEIFDPSVRARCRTLLHHWISGGALVVVDKEDENRKKRKFVEVGQWVTE